MSHLFTLHFSPIWFTPRDNPENFVYFDRVKIFFSNSAVFHGIKMVYFKNSEDA